MATRLPKKTHSPKNNRSEAIASRIGSCTDQVHGYADTGEDNGNANVKRQITRGEVALAVTVERLDIATRGMPV